MYRDRGLSDNPLRDYSPENSATQDQGMCYSTREEKNKTVLRDRQKNEPQSHQPQEKGFCVKFFR